jgi:hypothetical protein
MPTATPPSPATPLPSSATTLYDFDLTSADPADKSKTRTLSRPPSLETIPASHSNAISPAKAEEALGRQDAAVGSGGEWMAPPIGRANTVELDGRLFPTRSGRGAELGEPLTDVRTREQLVYIDWPDGDPEVCPVSSTSWDQVLLAGDRKLNLADICAFLSSVRTLSTSLPVASGQS